MGFKAFRDPRLAQDFAAPRLSLDVADAPTPSMDEQVAVFNVDGTEVRRCAQPPAYPLRSMLAVFDFPEWSTGDDGDLVPAPGRARSGLT